LAGEHQDKNVEKEQSINSLQHQVENIFSQNETTQHMKTDLNKKKKKKKKKKNF